MLDRTQHIINRYEEYKREKIVWYPLYELIGKWVMTRKQHFQTEPIPGEMLNSQVDDDTAINALTIMASTFVGTLWPNGAKTIRISPPFGLEAEMGLETDEVKDYYEFVTRQMVYYMDHPKAGFVAALEEYFIDQGAFGTSGIFTEEIEDDDSPLSYRAVDVKSSCIDENKSGFVDTVFTERIYTLRQMVDEYGFDILHEDWKELYANGDVTTKVKVLQVIEPRRVKDPYAFGNKAMDIASIHIDLSKKKVLRESGYLELPIAVGRFTRAIGEKYGRSPAMAALPSILEINAIREASILAVEKQLDPPLLVRNDGSMGGGRIDTSPGGVTVVSESGRVNGTSKPIEPLFLVGELQSTMTRITELTEIIKNHFFQDRLLDLNNETRMTLGEANIRNRLRGQTLNTIYSRQMAEVLVPVIERTFNILYRRGLLGAIPGTDMYNQLIEKGVIPKEIPEAVARRIEQNRDVFRIEFISPAMRIMQTEEVEGIEYLTTFTANMAAVKPEALDSLDIDFIVRRVQELSGAPRESVLSTESIKRAREQRQQMQEAMMQQEQMRNESEVARNVGQAASSVGMKVDDQAA